MRNMLRRIALVTMLTLALVLPAAGAGAQDYPGGTDEGVLSDNLQRDPGGAVAPASQTRGAPSTLPLTGTDTLQLAGLGLVLVAGGAVLVLRSRRRPSAAAA
jgi:LPXTG-motif cell wall-anchored protein